MKFDFFWCYRLLFIWFIVSACAEKPDSNLIAKKYSSQSKVDSAVQIDSTATKPKNVIFLIGDGMGLSEVSASLFYQDQVSNFERFSTIGLIKTSSSSELVTDSAAGATAFASGVKTYNGAISVDQDSISVTTIIEHLEQKEFSTGIISTSAITHATPACFYAHTKSRKNYEDIALFLPTSNIDFFAGGGLEFFKNRKDEKNLFDALRNNDYDLHTEKLPEIISEKKQAILLAEDGMPKMLEGRGDFLPDATKLALDKLSNNKAGFMLVIEGSQIDWGGHDNDADYLITELLDFDKTIGVALDFALQNGETLVLVTGDHETGGFTLAADKNDYNIIVPKFATGRHSATMIPVFAQGPGSSVFGGIYENTDIYHKLIALLKD
jgi:alkaline phosphatase